MKTYSDYLREVNKIDQLIDHWYEIASDKYAHGDKPGQTQAYAEIGKLQARKNELANPEKDELLTGNEKWFEI